MYKSPPPRTVPSELFYQYTLNDQIPVLDWWLDGSNDLEKVVWDNNYVSEFVNRFTPYNIKNNKHLPEPYKNASQWILKAVEKYNIKNKKVAVVGSLTPWIEAILLNFHNEVVTVEYNVPEVDYPNLYSISYWAFQKTANSYDCIVTYSSIEHSGLGRYGDPLDPNADIIAMRDIRNNLVNGGILIWGAPVGHDAVVWNAHRIYGKIRLPIIFNGFEELEWIDIDKKVLLGQELKHNSINPVVVLKKV